MHRSGTSGVTRLLNLAGAYFGPDGIATEPNIENPRGFWERRDVREVCDGLLQSAGFDWWKLVGFDVGALAGPDHERWLGRFAQVVSELDEHRPWVIKEPRLSILFPLLRPLLDAAVCVHVTREPLEVARSMHQRDGFPVPAALALWEVYTRASVEASAGLPRVHVRHRDLLADPVGTTAKLVDDLRAQGVDGLHHVSDDEVLGFISQDLHRQHQRSEERRWHLNGSQAELAAALDDGSAFGPDRVGVEVSAGALDSLAQLERERSLVAQLERSAEQVEELEASGRALEVELSDAVEAGDAARAEAADQSRYREVEIARRRELGRQADEALNAIGQQVRRFDASRVGVVARRLVSLRQIVTPGATRTVAGPLDPALAELSVRRDELRALREQEPAPGGAAAIMFPGEDPAIRRTRPRRRTHEPDRPSVAVASWDVGHNPLGRANVLAEVLARDFDVELWGAQFPRYGQQVWAPLRSARTPINVFDGAPLPDHLRTVQQVVRSMRADAVWVSKPRLPSFLLGIEAKRARNRPLVLDVDDHELAFFQEDAALDLEALRERTDGLELPFERDWTRVCDGYIELADQVTVSNVELEERYGGLVVPHARDERRFDPQRFDRDEVRRRLGVPVDERLLLFGGTPRVHKGVVEVLQALERLGDDRYRVMMFGTKEFQELRSSIGDLARWARVLPALAFDELPELLAAADLACVVQDPSHPVSRYQMPAKVSDAMAMEVPCLVARTPPLVPLIDAGLLEVVDDPNQLHTRIAEIFDDLDVARARAARARTHFLAESSYAAVAKRVVPMFEALMDDPPPMPPGLVRLSQAAAAVTDGGLAPPTTPVREPRRSRRDLRALRPGDLTDIVVFWKQNDSEIYGRRQDMLVDELARSGRVGKIVHFDRPITPEQVVESYRAGGAGAADQGRLVATQTAARVARRRDAGGVVRRTYVFGGRFTHRLGLPGRGGHVDYVRKVLAREGIGDRPFVLWAYPTNRDLPMLIDELDPDVVVSDVVDDNRTWYEPGSPQARDIEENYREVLSRSDLVLANCEPVARSMEAFVDDVVVVPNGCELPVEGGRCGPRPAALAGLRGPLIAYVGNLSSRLDVELVDAVATRRPGWSILLVGSAHLDGDALRLAEHANVHLLGVLPYRDVQLLLAHVDVGLIPHLDNEMTRSMNPLKAFVYASAGVPAVATPVANLPDLGPALIEAQGADAFISAIEAQLAAGRDNIDRARLEPYSWKRRVEQVFAALDEVLDG